MIGVGRELSPEYDHALADIYLRFAHPDQEAQSQPSRLFDGPNRVRDLMSAAALALAALAFSLALFHGGSTGYGTNPSVFAPQIYDRHDFYWRSDGPWHGEISPSTPLYLNGDVSP